MSGWNFSKSVGTSTLVLALGAGFIPGIASAATKTSTTTLANPYQVIVPKTFEYDTTGVIRTGGAAASTISGPSQLAFSGVTNATYATGSNQTIQLGQFVVNPVSTASGTNAVTTYHDTPFVIQVRAPEYDKTSKVPLLADVLPNFGRAFHLKTQTLNSLLIKGHLDGTVNGSGQSSVTATVDSTKLGGIQASSKSYAVKYAFPVHYGDLKLPTSWTMNTAGAALATTTPASSTDTTVSTVSSTSASAQILATPAAETLTSDLSIPTPTPEPSSVVIFAAALGGFAWSRRRWRAARPQASL